MALKDVADLATSLTLIVAALTFVYTIWERNSRERRRELEDWQRVLIYDLIETGAIEFDEIRTRYVVAAQQFSGFRIPRKAIQDGALKRLLLSMVEARLISITDADTYAVNRVSQSEDQFKRAAIVEMQKRQGLNTILSTVFQTLDSDSGKFTIDQLYRSARAQEMGLSFEDFDILVREQITRGAIVSFSDGKLWARGRIPQRPPNQTGGTTQKS